MTPCLKDITTHAWCIEHARPALGGAIPIGCAVAQQASKQARKQASKQASSILFESNDSIPGEEACIMLSRRGFLYPNV